ncbi:aspartate aminotransferase family protein [Corynebacterium lubricantis]|uniref:aspartate aminotransferase family protein n=1 Tax=Corynebacterium lubricantis TaxID=541095 RepID=UPI00035D1667|nr:aspartate aminotransferase family protein [Corynebacterium lubricantis]
MSDNVFYSWSAQDLINPVEIVSAEGVRFTDSEGKEYLDFASQLVNTNLGHQHPKLVQAIKDQADVLSTVQPAFKNSTRSELARLIVEAAPGDHFKKVFFTNGGAEAVENAIRMARSYTGRRKVLSAYRSYHGATSMAIALTGEPRRWKNEPTDASVVRFHGPYTYRSAFYAENEEQECERALEHLEQTIVLEGPETFAALIMEPVIGSAGVLVPPEGYLKGLREICDKYGIVYIADEVMVGFGRTGAMFAVDNWGVVPDLITFAKGVNSGYVPLGGVIMSEDIANTWATTPYHGGLTYSGHPLACAPGVATFGVLEEENIVERTRDLGERVVKPRLEQWREKYNVVGDVRGLGLFWAVEFVKDSETREPLIPFNASGEAAAPMAPFSKTVKEHGVWPLVSGNRIHIAPPLVISEEDLNKGLDAIEAGIIALEG